MPEPQTLLYHERQAFARQLCAAHALNNLTQTQAFSPAAVAAVARALAPGGAHAPRLLGGGNYDVNVLQAAASQIGGLDLSYFDARKAADASNRELEALVTVGAPVAAAAAAAAAAPAAAAAAAAPAAPPPSAAVVGLVLNVAVPGWWGRLRGARHWLALLPVFESENENGDLAWYNLDSMLRAPEQIGGADEAAAFLRQRLAEGGTLLVARRAAGEEQQQQRQKQEPG